MISYAQNLEDIVLNRAFQNKPTGFYIDVGAHDPVELSVTKLFCDLGWRGINIEPVTKSYEKLMINRPDDINLNIALGAKHDFLSIYEIENHPEYTSMKKNIAETSGKLTDSKIIKSKIETRTLKEVCDQHCDSFIDFIKIDVEGFEHEVILGADFSKYRPTMIVVEATNPCKAVIEDWENIEVEASWHDWEPLLFESKYLLVYYDGLNRFYLREEDEHLKKYFAIPITLIQDDFTVYSAVKEIDILKTNNNKLEERTIALKEQFEKVSEKCSSLNDMCEQNDLKFKKLSKEHLLLKKDAKNKEILINSKIKENTKLKGENQEIKNELGDRKKEYESLKASLAEKDLNLKQATKDNNKLRNENKQIEVELRDRKEECKSISAFLAEKDLNLKQATKDNNKLRNENKQIEVELRDRKEECKSISASLAEKDLNLKQATKDNNKLRNENKQIEVELRDRKEECKSISASLAEKDLNLKQAISDNYKLNYQNQNITIKNRQMLNKFSIIEKKYVVLNACVKQKNLNLNKKKWFRLFDHFQIYFSLKENFFKNEFKTNIENPNPVSDKEITKKNLNLEYLKNCPSVFSINFRRVTSVIREESSKKGYDLVLDTEKLLSLKLSFPKTEWIGICHVPFELPDWFVKTKAYIPYAKWLTSNEVLRAAKTNCKSLIAFSKDHSEKIQSKTGINTDVIKIPNYEICEKWSWEAFEVKSERKIVQVGWWLMRMNAIHIFPDSLYKKIWIHKSDKNADEAFAVEREYLKNRNLFFNYMDESVTVYNHLTAKEYAEIMCSNIAFIHYYDVSAPDFVLECIARHTPILVNPLPAVREYLGDEYPFYYYFYNDAVAKAENKRLVKSAHEYLSQLANKMELIPGGISTQIRSYLKDV